MNIPAIQLAAMGGTKQEQVAPFRSGLGYLLLCISLSSITMRVANAIVIIIASYTVMASPPFIGDLAAHPPDSVVQQNYTILCLSF